VWSFLGLPEPTPLQYDIAWWLQHGPKRQVIEAFRGCGKSWITSAYVLWRLLKNPQEKFLVVSASKQRADDFSTFTLRLIKDIPILKHLTPRVDQRESKIAFDVAPALPAHAASVKSAGIFGQITGSRSTHIIADDIEVANNSATQDMREKLLNAISEFEAIIVPEGNPRITFLGTPQTEESIYNKMAAKGYTVRIWPARFPTSAKIESYRGNLAPSLMERLELDEFMVGKPTDPDRFNDIELMEREASYGASGFALQFMLDTSLSDAEKYPLKLADLVIMNVNPFKAPIGVQWGSGPAQIAKDITNVGFSGDRWHRPLFWDDTLSEYEGSVMAIDPSGRGGDETTYAIVNQLHGNLFVVDMGGFKGGYTEETLKELAKLAKHNKVNDIVIESNFGDGMFTKLFLPVLRKFHKCAVDEVRHNTQKERRIIDTLEPLMNQHRVIMNEDIVRKDAKRLGNEQGVQYSIFYQITRLTKERGALKHDDAVDVLAMACAYWVEAMSRDEDQAMEDHKEEALEVALEEHLDHLMGISDEKPNECLWWDIKDRRV
jgi:hypothetical protein